MLKELLKRLLFVASITACCIGLYIGLYKMIEYSYELQHESVKAKKEADEFMLVCKTEKYKDNIRNKILTCVRH